MHFNKAIKIGNYTISRTSKAFIIAEAGINHNGDEKIAKNLIDCAVKAGVDAVKFQAFRTDKLILRDTKKAPYQLKTTRSEESQFDMLKKLELTSAQTLRLMRYAAEKKILFLTTPFDEASLGALDKLDLPAYKVSSTDITNLPFLARVAKKKKPIVLSTGMTHMGEIRKALVEIRRFNKKVILLQCTSNYPIRENEANLNVINAYKKEFDILVGYSDHSEGIGASPYAVSMGAKVIEKHFTLDKNMVGPDHKASLEPRELKSFVKEIRKVERYLGSAIKKPTRRELEVRKSMQKNLVASRAIKRGERFTARNIVAKRTGGRGRSPIYYKDIMSKKAEKNYRRDEIIRR